MEKKILGLHLRYQACAKGFTLLEILLAMFIGSIVLTALYTSFFQIIKAKDSAESQVETYHEARVVFSRLTKDIETTYRRGRTYSTTGPNLSSFVGRKDGTHSFLSFTSLSHDPGLRPGESDQAEISYYLEPVPDSDLFYLVRRENPSIGIDGAGIAYPVSDRIIEFDVSYIANIEEGLSDEWDSATTGTFPRALSVTLTMMGARGESLVFNSLIVIPAVNSGSPES